MYRTILAILPMVLICGCGTCMNLQTEPSPYGGVRLDAGFISNLHPSQMKTLEGDSQGWAVMFGIASIFDLPLSAAADTLVLPLTMPRAIERGHTVPDRKVE